MEMKMATMFALFGSLLLVAAVAEDANTTTDDLPAPLIGYGHPFYGLKKGWEKIQLTFALDDNTRAQVRAKLALNRLSELKQLLKENRTTEAQVLIDQYEAEVNQTRQLIESSFRNGTVPIGLMRAFNATGMHLVQLEKVKARVCEQRNETNSTVCLKMEFAIQRSAKGHENLFEKIGPHMDNETRGEMHDAMEKVLERQIEKEQDKERKEALKEMKEHMDDMEEHMNVNVRGPGRGGRE